MGNGRMHGLDITIGLPAMHVHIPGTNRGPGNSFSNGDKGDNGIIPFYPFRDVQGPRPPSKRMRDPASLTPDAAELRTGTGRGHAGAKGISKLVIRPCITTWR